MTIELGNFSREILDTNDFSLCKYIEKNGLSKTRLYLMTKKKSSSKVVRDYEYSFSSDSDFDEPKEQQPKEPKLNVIDISLPKQLDSFKAFKVLCDSTLYNPAYWSMFD